MKEEAKWRLAKSLKSLQQTLINQNKRRFRTYNDAVLYANKELATKMEMNEAEVVSLVREYTVKIMVEARKRAAESRRLTIMAPIEPVAEIKRKRGRPRKVTVPTDAKVISPEPVSAATSLKDALLLSKTESLPLNGLEEFGVRRMWNVSLDPFKKLERMLMDVVIDMPTESEQWLACNDKAEAARIARVVEKNRKVMEDNGKYYITYKRYVDKYVSITKKTRPLNGHKPKSGATV